MFRWTEWACNLAGGNAGSILIERKGVGVERDTESFSRQGLLVTWHAKWGCVVQWLIIITLTEFSLADCHDNLGCFLALCGVLEWTCIQVIQVLPGLIPDIHSTDKTTCHSQAEEIKFGVCQVR